MTLGTRHNPKESIRQKLQIRVTPLWDCSLVYYHVSKMVFPRSREISRFVSNVVKYIYMYVWVCTWECSIIKRLLRRLKVSEVSDHLKVMHHGNIWLLIVRRLKIVITLMSRVNIELLSIRLSADWKICRAVPAALF